MNEKEKYFIDLIQKERESIPDFQGLDSATVLKLLQFVREATIAEAMEYCVSQDWIKTIDNLKRMPTDRILDFELQTDLPINK